MNATGKGFALVEVSYRYNMKEPEPKSAFSLMVDARRNATLMSLDIKVQYKPPNVRVASQKSNMAILEVSMPSGFVVDDLYLETIKSKLPAAKLIQTKNSDTVVIFYFDSISAKAESLRLVGLMKYSVDDLKPASVDVYDYYDSCKWKPYTTLN